MVAITGAVVKFIPVKAGIFPVPDAASPISGWLFVQEIVAKTPVKAIEFERAPLQITLLAGILTEAVGFIVMINDEGVPVQPFAEGVTVIVANIGTFELFVARNEGIFPDPFAGKPIAVLLFDQVKVVPATGPLKATTGLVAPLQYSSSASAFTVGLALTPTVTFCEFEQPLA